MEKRKPLLITLAVCVGVIASILALALLLRVRGGARVPVTDVPYPYEWTEKRDGSLVLKLDGGSVPGGLWSTDSTGDGIVHISADETQNGKAAVRLTPDAEGRAVLTFALTNEGERLAEAVFTVETLEKGGRLAVTVTDHRERVLQETVRGGEDTGHPFTVRSDESGALVIHIVDPAVAAKDGGDGVESVSERWTVRSSNSTVVLSSEMQAADDGFDLYLRSRWSGNTELFLSCPEEKLMYVFTVTSESGVLRLLESRLEEYRPEEPMPETEVDALLSGLADSLSAME